VVNEELDKPGHLGLLRGADLGVDLNCNWGHEMQSTELLTVASRTYMLYK
jgi:hypothetical protein